MLEVAQIAALAAQLHAAERAGQQIRQFSLAYPAITFEDAYAIQRAWVALKLAEGRTVKGHKIGLTSRAMQVSSQIDQPDHGVLLDDMFFPEGSDIPMARFIVPRVEVELAFILGKPLTGPNCTIFDVLAATEYVIPAIEIIDARLHNIDPETKIPRKVFDTIADNAANAGLVLGGRPVRPLEVDLRWVAALLYRNGVIEESGVAAAVLNHPANGVAWLANKLHRFGETLEPGQVILGGSFTRPVPRARATRFISTTGRWGRLRVGSCDPFNLSSPPARRRPSPARGGSGSTTNISSPLGVLGVLAAHSVSVPLRDLCVLCG